MIVGGDIACNGTLRDIGEEDDNAEGKHEYVDLFMNRLLGAEIIPTLSEGGSNPVTQTLPKHKSVYRQNIQRGNVNPGEKIPPK